MKTQYKRKKLLLWKTVFTIVTVITIIGTGLVSNSNADVEISSGTLTAVNGKPTCKCNTDIPKNDCGCVYNPTE